MIVNWTEHGVFWDGAEGSPVERLDDPDVGEPKFPGDMEAALYAAQNSDMPWVVYRERGRDKDTGEVPSPSWDVTLYLAEPSASYEVAYHLANHSDDLDPPVAFYFDGCTQTPTDGPDGVGYLPPTDQEI